MELYIRIQIWTIQLPIFTEKFSPLLGFEPGTSPVPSRYATNWAILAWISIKIMFQWQLTFFHETAALIFNFIRQDLKYEITQSKLSKTQITRSVHCKFNCIAVKYNGTWHGIYFLYVSMMSCLSHICNYCIITIILFQLIYRK